MNQFYFITLIVVGVFFLLWILLNMKTSRPDGVHLGRIHPARKMLFYIMPGRNESIVYYDSYISVEKLLQYLKKINKRFHADIIHCLVGATTIGFPENPKMNRFVSGRRLYQRRGWYASFSMLRVKADRSAKLSVVKMELNENETFRQLCERINGNVAVERSDKVTYQDKETGILSRLPRPVLNIGVRLFKWLDYNNILPWSFIKNDAMYTSVFIANLGSIDMGPAYHHLYEWGNCSLFMMAGRIEERPVVVNGKITVQKILPIRYTYDERMDDALNSRFGIASVKNILENPGEYFGCLDVSGRDTHPLIRPGKK